MGDPRAEARRALMGQIVNDLPPEVSHSIRIVTAHVVSSMVADNVGEAWELYPEIGEHDWLKVQEGALAFGNLLKPTTKQFRDAYRLLEQRAEDMS